MVATKFTRARAAVLRLLDRTLELQRLVTTYDSDSADRFREVAAESSALIADAERVYLPVRDDLLQVAVEAESAFEFAWQHSSRIWMAIAITCGCSDDDSNLCVDASQFVDRWDTLKQVFQDSMRYPPVDPFSIRNRTDVERAKAEAGGSRATPSPDSDAQQVESFSETVDADSVAVRADKNADKKETSQIIISENKRVCKLDKLMKSKGNSGRSKSEIALEFTDSDQRQAKNLLRQIRRHRTSLDRINPPTQ